MILRITKYFTVFVTLLFMACQVQPIDPELINQVPTNPIGTPVLTTTALSNIASTTAASGGNITSDGGSPIISRGVVWSTNQNPTITNSKTINGSGIGVFTSSLTNLTAGTTYFVRAYATNSNGTAYGNQISFTTVGNQNLPVLTTTTVSNIGSNSALSGGNITSDGGSSVISRGVVWSTNQNPTVSNSKTIDGNGIGVFSSSISGLVAGTTYYLRAYATNSVGTAYGNQITFVTTGGGTGNSGFAMTASISGVQFQANSPFGDNNFSSTNIWSYFPIADYVMLQGRQGGLLGNPEINIWLKRTDIVVGTYVIGAETFDTPPSHFIDLTDNSSNAPGSEYTKDGTITITEVNTTSKTVKGTFSFRTTDSPSNPNAPITFTISNGTFNYKYSN